MKKYTLLSFNNAMKKKLPSNCVNPTCSTIYGLKKDRWEKIRKEKSIPITGEYDSKSCLIGKAEWYVPIVALTAYGKSLFEKNRKKELLSRLEQVK